VTTILVLFLLRCILADEIQTNVIGTPLQMCCNQPPTGFYRDGYCRTGPEDRGTHVVAATVTQEFLDFTKSRGNDLETPRPEFNFPGLKPGDKWCLCALRWKEAEQAGAAPPIDLAATNAKALEFIPIEILKKYQSQ
jgi:uncharacterized protein (DUF2237 family)